MNWTALFLVGMGVIAVVIAFAVAYLINRFLANRRTGIIVMDVLNAIVGICLIAAYFFVRGRSGRIDFWRALVLLAGIGFLAIGIADIWLRVTDRGPFRPLTNNLEQYMQGYRVALGSDCQRADHAAGIAEAQAALAAETSANMQLA